MLTVGGYNIGIYERIRLHGVYTEFLKKPTVGKRIINISSDSFEKCLINAVPLYLGMLAEHGTKW